MNDYVIAKYLRLSVDDGKSESMSIANQRLMLDRQIEEIGISYSSMLEFVDDGHSGVTMERPAILDLLDQVQSGRVNCIIVKDFSRFSRSSMDSEFYLAQVFPLYRVRFISVADRYDSNDYIGDTGGLDVSFKFLMHEFYSQDLSKKTYSALKVKRQRGEYITANAIYGYLKNSMGKWEPDPEAAETVRLIYKLALEGQATGKIRDRLCSDRYPTPREYSDLRRGREIIPVCRWSVETVRYILKNEQYTGSFVSGRQGNSRLGERSMPWLDRSQWIIIPDSHPAIISKDEFEVMQGLLRRCHNPSRKIDRQHRDYLLSGGLVKCGCCSHTMSFNNGRHKKYYHCRHTLGDQSAGCHRMKVPADELHEAVLTMIKKQAEIILASSGISDLKVKDVIGQSVVEVEKQLRQAELQRQECYERFVLGEICRDEYMMLKAECATRIEGFKKHIGILRQAERETQVLEDSTALAAKVIEKAATPREIVTSLVERVYVFPGDRIEIAWKVTDFALAV